MRFNIIALFILATLFASCKPKPSQPGADSAAAEEVVAESVAATEESDETPDFKPLNEIRFGDWDDEDWLDNDYFRHLRKHIDKWYAGEVECADLEKYREKIGNSKFVILSAEPFVMGGLFVDFAFVEAPNLVFQTNVYSDVDEEKEIVTGYTVKPIKLSADDAPFTKEHILKIIKEHPENKMW